LLAAGGLYAGMWNRQREADAAREKLREAGEDAVESTQPNRNPPPVEDDLGNPVAQEKAQAAE
jgi:ATP-binding cassette subfamily B protein